MRKYAVLAAVLAASVIICPCAAFAGKGEKNSPVSAPADGKNDYISVMSSAGGAVKDIEMREYIIGCVAAEMSPMCHTEALKAQAAASYTYAVRIKERGNPLSGSWDITDDPDYYQGYMDEEKRRTSWGEDFEKNENKIAAAVDAVAGKLIVYKGETALTVYHGISAGRTRSAENLWEGDYPYLKGTESPGDKLSPDFVSETEFTAAEFRECAEKCGVSVSGEEKNWLGKSETDSDGYTKALTLCGESVTGSEIREAFGLPGACFTVKYEDGKFIFTCKGNGHGVGMSQYGADYMARQGATWEEIIKHYYTGVEIKDET